jgi:hypothetical protein
MKYDIKIWEWTDRKKRIMKFGERIFRLQFEINDKKKNAYLLEKCRIGCIFE